MLGEYTLVGEYKAISMQVEGEELVGVTISKLIIKFESDSCDEGTVEFDYGNESLETHRYNILNDGRTISLDEDELGLSINQGDLSLMGDYFGKYVMITAVKE